MNLTHIFVLINNRHIIIKNDTHHLQIYMIHDYTDTRNI